MAILLAMLLLLAACKENKDITPTSGETTENGMTDGESMGEEATDDAAGGGETNKAGQNPTDSNSSVSSESPAGSGNANAFSGDGSDGRTAGTSVNKAKKVQVANRNNARAKSKSGYSAPNGTAAENNDGDMYTKHDTTRMPSGSTPIK